MARTSHRQQGATTTSVLPVQCPTTPTNANSMHNTVTTTSGRRSRTNSHSSLTSAAGSGGLHAPYNTSSRRSAREKTPPPACSISADGVDGFMFTSPQRQVKKVGSMVTAASPDVLPVNHRAVRRLFPMEASSTPTSDTKVAHRNTPRSKQINPISTRPTSKQESASGDPDLFSPYKWSREHSQHCYNTRAMATLRQQLTNRETKTILAEKTDTQDRVELIEKDGTLEQHRIHVETKSTVLTVDHVVQEFPIAPQDVRHMKESLDLMDLETEEAIDSFLLIQRLVQYPAFRQEFHVPVLPALHDERITLVLDLDETLVHCSTEASKLPCPDLNFTVNFQNRDFDVFAQKRPYLMDFLKVASSMFELVIFTASQKIYADTLLDLLDPERQYTKFRLFRDSCIPVEGTFVKDLRILGRDLSRVVIVDNAVEAFSYQVRPFKPFTSNHYQINNGVPIKSWFAENDDCELLKLLGHQRDVRPYLADAFGLRERIALAREP